MLRFRTDPAHRVESVWEKILADQSLEKARRFLIAGQYEKAIRLLHQLVKQPTCDWTLTLPILEDAERQYIDWFLKHRMTRTDVPQLQSYENYPALDGNGTFLIQRIDGTRNLQQLIEMSPMREIEVLLVMQQFLDAKLITIDKPEARVSTANTAEGSSNFPFYALKQLLYNLPFGILAVNPAGLVLHANDRFLQMSSLKPEEILNLPVTRIFGDQNFDEIRDNYEREFSWTGLEGRSAIRRRWLYSIHRFPSTPSDETPAIVLVRDISEMRTRQLDQFRKDRLTSLGEFVAGMTHQLKNPIMMLDTGVKLLCEEKLSEEDTRDVANRMQKNIDRMRTLISDILSYVAMDESSHTWINLNNLIGKTVALLREQIEDSGISLQFKPMSDPPVIRGNETQIREVVINLVSNAVQAMKQTRGRVEISTDIQEELEGGVYRNYLLMVVSDTGPGMDHSVMEKLFTPFFTTKSGGKGLGLAFAKRIVEEQGGFIRVWSKEGIGTHFYVYFRIGES